MKKLLRITEVCDVVALSRSEIYRRMKAGTFPRPCVLGQRARAWSAEEVQAFVQARIAAPRVQAIVPTPRTIKMETRVTP